MFAAIREYLRVVKPKTVLWFYYEGNDLENLRREKKSPLLMSYLTSRIYQDLLHKQSEIDQSLVPLSEGLITRRRFGLFNRYRLGRAARLVTLRQQLGIAYGYGKYEEELELFSEILYFFLHRTFIAEARGRQSQLRKELRNLLCKRAPLIRYSHLVFKWEQRWSAF